MVGKRQGPPVTEFRNSQDALGVFPAGGGVGLDEKVLERLVPLAGHHPCDDPGGAGGHLGVKGGEDMPELGLLLGGRLNSELWLHPKEPRSQVDGVEFGEFHCDCVQGGLEITWGLVVHGRLEVSW